MKHIKNFNSVNENSDFYEEQKNKREIIKNCLIEKGISEGSAISIATTATRVQSPDTIQNCIDISNAMLKAIDILNQLK